jgi:leucyl aminopeptidase
MIRRFIVTVDNIATVGSSAIVRIGSSTPTEVVRGRDAIELTVQSLPATKRRVDAIVVGAFADGQLSPTAQTIDASSKGRLSAVLKSGDLGTKTGAALVLYDVPASAATRVVLVGLGLRDEFSEKAYIEALGGALRVLEAGPAKEIGVALAELDVPGRSLEWRLQIAGRVLADGYYRFAAPKTNGSARKNEAAPHVTLFVAEPVTPALELAARRGRAIAEGMALAKDLGNLPGNVCHPAYLADAARALAQEFKMEVEVLERADMDRLGMGSALSVGRSSDQPCKFIVLKYAGGREKDKPIVLIGKGVTFDTGGVSLKPGEDLDMMKYDMCGAASVFGALKTVARLGMPLNVVGIVGAVENMPGGNATRPGDVVVSMSGQTIEILNTDAEGRLVLCDAMTYAERFNPECVIDIATLTGACVIALGDQASGLFANDDELAKALYRSGADAADRAWRMPLWDEYQEQLKSNFADMSNLGGRPAGAVTAACFLARFAKAYKWAHLDIAGTASVGGERKGATGRPVPLLAEFLWTCANGATAS